MKDFKDKVVVVTGAASGMGRSYAIEFAKLGAKLGLCDNNKEELDEALELVKQTADVSVYAELLDVSDREAMFRFADNVKKELGNTHIIINNAGIEGTNQPVYVMEIEAYERVMDVNFYGVLYGTKAFLPQIVENNEGAVVNVSSIFGLFGPANHSGYSATKFAVRGFTEALALEFMDSPISIHCVHPGGINTNISKYARDQQFAKKYLTTPPEDIVRYVIKCIRKKRQKIVYGNGHFRAWAGSNLLPQWLFNKIAWREMRKVVNWEDYKKFVKQ